ALPSAVPSVSQQLHHRPYRICTTTSQRKGPHLRPPRSSQNKTKHKNDSNVRHALCSSDIRTVANTLQDQKVPTLRRTVKEGTPMKKQRAGQNIDGISNTTSPRRGELDWDIISATHCLTVAPRHFWLAIYPPYHLSKRPICTVLEGDFVGKNCFTLYVLFQ